MATCWNTPCTEPITDVVLVPTCGEASPLIPYMPLLTCSDHAPELMHELLCEGHDRKELITAIVEPAPLREAFMSSGQMLGDDAAAAAVWGPFDITKMRKP